MALCLFSVTHALWACVCISAHVHIHVCAPVSHFPWEPSVSESPAVLGCVHLLIHHWLPGGQMGGAGLGAQPGQQRGRASRRLCHRWSPLSVLPPSSSLAGGSSCVPLAALASPQPPGAAPYSPTRSSRQSPAVARAGARAGQPSAPKARDPRTWRPRSRPEVIQDLPAG